MLSNECIINFVSIFDARESERKSFFLIGIGIANICALLVVYERFRRLSKGVRQFALSSRFICFCFVLAIQCLMDYILAGSKVSAMMFIQRATTKHCVS